VRELMRRLRRGDSLRDLTRDGVRASISNDDEISRVVATGPRTHGTRAVVTIDCVATAKPGWNASAGDMDTGIPASIVAQMIATGEIGLRGVMPPETAVPVERFVSELRDRGFRVTMSSSKYKVQSLKLKNKVQSSK
jgi:hypothetical protein